MDVNEVRPPLAEESPQLGVARANVRVHDPAWLAGREAGKASNPRVARAETRPRDLDHVFAALGDRRINGRFVRASEADECDAIRFREPPHELRGDAAAAVWRFRARRVGNQHEQSHGRHTTSAYSAS
jgi:hypothetical protein